MPLAAHGRNMISTCKHSGCDLPHLAKGLCHRHYRRWVQSGKPSLSTTLNLDAICLVPFCKQPQSHGGLCTKHKSIYQVTTLGNIEKRCATCKQMKPLKEFHSFSRSKPDWYKSYCIPCEREYMIAWDKKNLHRSNASHKKTRDRLRDMVLNGYGHKCACCGESRMEFLAIDHKNNDGNHERRKMGTNYLIKTRRKIVRENFPDTYQLLCHNCNCAKGFFGYCPHEKERATT